MNEERTVKKKPSKLVEMKVLVATLSLAATLGLWNLFAGQVYAESSPAQETTVEIPSPPPAGAALGLPPIPTLVPFLKAEELVENTAAVSGAAQPEPTAAEQFQLRKVAEPTQVIVQKGPMIVSAPVVEAPSGGGSDRSSSSSSGSKPRSRSS